MQLRMTIDEAIAAAREWTRGTTLHEDSDSPRVWCILMDEEIDRLRARVAMLEDDANEGRAITAMPIQIGEDQCYLPVNAHYIVKRMMLDNARMIAYLEMLSRCPCCHELRNCIAECTFESDDWNEHAMMMEARRALYADGEMHK